MRDVIDFGAGPGNFFGYINQNRQKDDGFEVELAVQPFERLNISGYYAYVDGTVRTPSGENFNLFRRPRNTVGAGADLQVSEKVSLSVMYRWADKRRDRYYDASIPPFGETVEVGLDPFHLLDAYLQYQPVQKLTLFVDAKNLLDTKYTEFAGYTTRGVNFNAGVKFLFQ